MENGERRKSWEGRRASVPQLHVLRHKTGGTPGDEAAAKRIYIMITVYEAVAQISIESLRRHSVQ